MHKKFKFLYFLVVSFFILNCSGDDSPLLPDDEIPTEVSPVVFDINAVPYPNLSDYNFFKSPMKNQDPVYGVLPFKPASQLFTDYAEKKRFVWMPEGVSASIGEDNSILNFPVGTVLIKNFYYDQVQPGNTTKIIESRLMIMKPEGWIFANYVWNEAQNEAVLSENLITVPINFVHNGTQREINYQIPSTGQCFMCHYSSNENMPIGPKPQNLNFAIQYPDGLKNQLEKLKEFGYINNSIPTQINSIVDYTDTSKSIDLRARSYMEINCGHCHKNSGYAEFYPIRLDFKPIPNYDEMGFCLEPNINHGAIPPGVDHLIYPGNHEKSVMYYRMISNDESFKMPMIGRTIVHDEGVDLLNNWIDSFEEEDCL